MHPEAHLIPQVPDNSFVILTWNSENYIRACVDSIFASLQGASLTAEVFIVDNGSADRTPILIRELAQTYEGRLVPVFLEKNFGTTYSRNLALARCRGTYVCILDSDVEVGPGTVRKLIRTLEADSSRALAAPKLVYPDGRLQKSVDRFPTPVRKLVRYFRLKAIEAKEAETGCGTGVRPVDYAISALWVFRRSLLAEIGFLDEKIFYAPEDADFCLRVWKAGYQVVYVPEAVAVHHTQEKGRGFRITATLIHHLLGLGYFFFKHRIFFGRPKLGAQRQ